MIPRQPSSDRPLRASLPLLGIALAAGVLSGCASGNLASVAVRHEGKTARQLGLPPRLWCADFANLARREAGLRPVNSRRAVDQARNARPILKPVPGALMITSRPGGHHVDVVLAVNELFVEVAGGNVGGRVTRRQLPMTIGRFYLPT